MYLSSGCGGAQDALEAKGVLVVVARLVEHLSQADARASTVLIAALQLLVRALRLGAPPGLAATPLFRCPLHGRLNDPPRESGPGGLTRLAFKPPTRPGDAIPHHASKLTRTPPPWGCQLP